MSPNEKKLKKISCRRFYYDVIKRLVARWIALFLLSARFVFYRLARALLLSQPASRPAGQDEQEDEIGENGGEPACLFARFPFDGSCIRR